MARQGSVTVSQAAFDELLSVRSELATLAVRVDSAVSLIAGESVAAEDAAVAAAAAAAAAGDAAGAGVQSKSSVGAGADVDDDDDGGPGGANTARRRRNRRRKKGKEATGGNGGVRGGTNTGESAHTDAAASAAAAAAAIGGASRQPTTPGGSLGPGLTLPPHLRLTSMNSVSTAGTGTDTEVDAVRLKQHRPTIYPHLPQRGHDSMVEYGWEETEVLDALRMQKFEGLYNISAVISVFSLVYIAVRNVMQHGLFLSKSDYGCAPIWRDLRTMALLSCVNLLLSFIAFAAQQLFVRGTVSHTAVVVLYVTEQCLSALITIAVIYMVPLSPAVAMVCIMGMMVLMLKSHSYVATNYALYLQNEGPPGERVDPGAEAEAEDEDEDDTPGSREAKARRRTRRSRPASWAYPNNVTFGNWCYFIAAPTLVYEPRYLRTKKIRKWYVVKKASQALLCGVLQYALAAQFMLPVLRGDNSSHNAFIDGMKLAVPSFLGWLVMFYGLFHCQLSVAAELLRFADRRFFLDFWNATTVGAFWRLWNIPVHEFCLRHIYVETQHYYKVSKKKAVYSTFLFSAVMHEVLFSVAFKTLRPWFMLGMLLQVPLDTVSRQFKGTRKGNILMWLGLFLGQPCLVYLYFREWYETHDQFFCVYN